MKNFRSAIIFAFSLFTFTFNIFAQDESRASKTWEVVKYDLTATLPADEKNRYLIVKANLELKNVGTTAASRLTLRISPSAEVSAVNINGTAAEFSKGEEKLGSGTLQRIILRSPSVQPNSNFSVSVDYKLKNDANSGLNALSSIQTQFLPLSFWYPTPNSWYFARGGDYAPTKIQMNSANGLSLLASGAETAGSFDQKMSVQPFFVAGNWDKIEANGIALHLPKGSDANSQARANELAALASEAKNFFQTFFGMNAETPFRIISVRRGGGFSAGGTILIDDSVFRRQKLDSQSVMNLSEAVVKTWLGNAVNIKGDGFSVIQEGLSRYLATQFIENKYGKEIADMERLRQRTAYAAVVKRDAPLNTVSPLDDYYFTSNSNKGAMIWRLLAKKVGQTEFSNVIKSSIKDGSLELNELRAAFPSEKDFFDNAINQVTDTDLLVGLPQTVGAETKIALRNTGSIDATVNIIAITVNGEKLNAQSTVPQKGFGEVSFKTSNKIIRVEVDTDKLYPQTDYSNDTAPKLIDESDSLLYVKRAFDKQDFATAERNARIVLQISPLFDDVRVLLGRSLLAQGKTAESEKEFNNVLNEKLPTARSLVWAYVGLGDIAAKSGQTANALKYYQDAIKADAEYGSTLAARQGRNKLKSSESLDENIKNYFTLFDKTAISNRKADMDAIVSAGEVTKFAGGLAGQTEQWQTNIVHIDKIDANNVWVEANLNIKLLNREPETGIAVYRLSKSGNNWKLSSVDMFEVR